MKFSKFFCGISGKEKKKVVLLKTSLDYELKSGKLSEYGDEYFEATEDGDMKELEKRRRNLERYKSVLNSKSNEEALVGTLYSLS